MALPFSRNTTYGVGSQIRSADLNELQDAVVAGKNGALIGSDSALKAFIQSGFAFADVGGNPILQLAASASGGVYFAIPLRVGDRLSAVRVICQHSGGVANQITAALVRQTAVSGNASATNTVLVSATGIVATTNLQTITLTPGSPETIAAEETVIVQINGANSAGTKSLFRIEWSYDHP
jgi:hypothetical protein